MSENVKLYKVLLSLRSTELSNFDKKIRKYAIPNLTLWLIIGYAIGYLITITKFDFLLYLVLDPYKIIHGQIWRLFTWVIIPPNMLGNDVLGLFFTLLMLFCCYTVGNILERAWGTVTYNKFIFGGIFLEIIAAFLYFGFICLVHGYDNIAILEMTNTVYDWFGFSTYFINISIYIVFAMSFPNDIVRIYFIIPCKMKWLGVLDCIYLVYMFLVGANAERYAIVAAGLNCFIFYLSNIKGKVLNPYQIHRQNSFKRKFNSGRSSEPGRGADKGPKMHPGTAYRHKCCICGKTDLSDPDMEFRYCSKCAGSYEYCSVHLFKHSHVRG